MFRICIGLLVLTGVFAAFADAGQFSRTIDLKNPVDAEYVPIIGKHTDDLTGSVLASGDLNGDGNEDFVIGAYPANSGKGYTYLVFGSGAFFDITEIDLDDYTSNIVRVEGLSALDWSGCSVAVGNLNGDAYDDVIIGAKKVDPYGRINAGAVYTIQGSVSLHTRGTILLSASTSGVIVLYGDEPGDEFGVSVCSGDIDGDAFDDVIIGASGVDYGDRINAGAAYVFFGSSGVFGTSIYNFHNELTNVAVIYGEAANDAAGGAVTSGDMDGDGRDDVVIGAVGSLDERGATYYFPGYANADTLKTFDLSDPPPEHAIPNGLVKIYGDDAGDHSGAALATGDFDGDGCDDLVMGAPDADPLNGNEAGETNVLFGSVNFKSHGVMYLGALTAQMIRVLGTSSLEYSGTSAATGKLNTDAYDDLVIGAPGAVTANGGESGAAYIVWGAADLKNQGVFDMTAEQTRVTRVIGTNAGDNLGRGVGIGDLDGDGVGDLALGSPGADFDTRHSTGIVSVIRGLSTVGCIDYTPRAGAYVNTDTNIELFFNTDLDSLRVEVVPGGMLAIVDSLDLNIDRAVFYPDTTYNADVFVDVTVDGFDYLGNAIDQTTWRFYTKADEVPPRVLFHTPERDEANVSSAENIVITFTPDVHRDSTTVAVTGESDRVITMTESWADSVLTLVNGNGKFYLDETINVEVSAADQYGDRADSTWSFMIRPESRPPYYTIKYSGNPQLLPKDADFDFYFPIDTEKDSVDIALEGSKTGLIEYTSAWTDTVLTVFHPSGGFKPGETLNFTVNAWDIHKNKITNAVHTFAIKLDEIAPGIVTRAPDANEINVATTASVAIEFTEDVVRDSTSISMRTLRQGNKTFTKSWEDYTLSLIPTQPFLVNDVVTVSGYAGDIYANRMTYEYEFKIRPEMDPPDFSVSVPHGQNIMHFTDPISLLFPRDIDHDTVQTSLLGTLDDPIPGTWAWNDTTFTFTPSEPYKPGYVLNLSVEAYDVNQNKIEKDVILNVAPDEIPPQIVTRVPEPNQVNVPLNQYVRIEFTDDVIADSTRVSLSSNRRTSLGRTLSWGGHVLRITPSSTLMNDETVTVSIDTEDRYENRVHHEWSFSTGDEIDLPYYTLTVPFGEELMQKSDSLTVVISDDVDAGSFSYTLTGSASGLLTNTWTQVDSAYTFKPAEDYVHGETLTLRLNAHDVHGNPIPEDVHVLKVRDDEDPPVIVSRSPESEYLKARPDDDIIITFSPDVVRDSTSVSLKSKFYGAFSMKETWDGDTLTLSRTESFSMSDRITVTVATGDTLANHTEYSWWFEVRKETENPEVTLSIAGDPDLLKTSEVITLTFSNDIDKQSVNVDFVDGDGKPVKGAWVWNGTRHIFTPDGYRLGDSLTMTVNGTDIDDNPLDETVYHFTVRADETPPSIFTISPEDQMVHVDPAADITIVFSDDVVPDSTSVAVIGSISRTIVFEQTWDGSTLTLVNDGRFKLGETINVSVRAADIYSNRTTLSWQFDIIPDNQPPYYQLIAGSDRDNIAVNGPITIAFPDDVNRGTVKTSIGGSESGALSGAWSWRNSDYTFTPSAFYEYGEKITLTVEASDRYGNRLPETSEELTVGMHTPWLVIDNVSPDISDEMTYRVDYTFGDPDNSFTKTRDWRYSVDGGLWSIIPESSVGGNISRGPGTWSITFRLPEELVGVCSCNVQFSMEVYDGLFGSGTHVSEPFDVDLNDPPQISVTAVTTDYEAGQLHVGYLITDSESDTVSVAFEYSPDGGVSWHEGTPVNDLSALTMSKYLGTVDWNYAEGLVDGTDYASVMVRLTPTDYKDGAAGVSSGVNVDLNDPPSVTLDDIYTTQSGDVTLTYHIQDTESDPVRFDCYYSTNGGGIWNKTEHVTGVENLRRYNGTFLWHSKSDLPSFESFDVRFRVVPFDNDTGVKGETASFQLFNNGPPLVTAIVPGRDGNVITLPFEASDPENNPLDIHVQWSGDGEQWNTASVSGDTDELTGEALIDTLYWDSRADLGEGLFENLGLRLFATDMSNPSGSSSLNYDTHTMTVDNIGPRLQSVEGTAYADTLYCRFDETVFGAEVLVKENWSLSHNLTIQRVSATSVQGVYGVVLTSGMLLPFETVTVTVSNLVDKLGNRTEETSFEFFPDDDNVNPNVKLSGITGEVGGSIDVTYTILDPEGDTVTITGTYSLDSGETWMLATLTGTIAGLTPSQYIGSFAWRSDIDLAGKDIDAVLFRAVARDTQDGDPYILGPFHLDNNQPPAVTASVADPDSVYSGDVEITHQIVDGEGDAVALVAEYSVDGGTTFLPATVTGELTDIQPGGYMNALVWDTSADIPDEFRETVFRLTASDDDGGEPGDLPLNVDNYGACRVVLTVSGDELTGDVPVSYNISDPRSRTVTLTVKYSIDDGVTWKQAMVDGPISNLGPTQYEGQFVWRTAGQLSGHEGTVRLRVEPNNGRDGIPAGADVGIDNNQPPTVMLSPITDEVSGDISVVFTVSDPEKDTISIAMQYSIDDGANWYTTEYGGPTDGFKGDGTAQTAIWNSMGDLPGREYTNVRIRLIVSDKDEGGTDEISVAFIDNNLPPSVSLSLADPEAVYEEYVDIQYELSDSENNMLSIQAFFSLDGGLTYGPATVTGKTSGIFSSGYSSTIRWEIDDDVSRFGDVLFKLIPRDNDAGSPDSLTVKANTFGTASVTLSAPVEEQEGDVTISYVIDDSRGNPVDFDVRYSINNGLSWVSATTSGSTTGIQPADYTGSFVWRALEDISGKELDCLVLVTPDNGAPGLPDTVAVSIDNNLPPVIDRLFITTDDVLSGPSMIQMLVQDNENDTAVIGLEYSLDGGKTYVDGFVAGSGSVPAGRPGSIAWSTFNDIGFTSGASVYLRLTPRDKDDGTPLIAGPFTVRNQVADFTFDQTVDAADMVAFISIWKSQDITRETGPATGEPPDLTVTPDGVIDFEDLTAFVRMWNWFSKEAAGKNLPVVAAKPSAAHENDGMDDIGFTSSGRGALVFASERPVDFFNVTVIADGESPVAAEAVQGEWWRTSQSMCLTRVHGTNSFEVAAARLDEPDATEAGAIDLGGVRLTQPSGDVIVRYDVRFAGTDEILSAETVVERDELFARPETFALGQNMPNPFNPVTTISFSVPRDTDVSLTVRNINGQIVEVLHDGFIWAGEYRYQWDGGRYASGMYFYTLDANGFNRTRKMLLVK